MPRSATSIMPGLRPVCARERAALVPEQLGLEQRIGQRGAVHGHEDLRRAGALDMDRPGDQLLPGARLPLDQDVGLGRAALPTSWNTALIAGLFPTTMIEAGASRERLSEAGGFPR